MRYTRLSLLYPITILLVSGLLLLLRPDLVFFLLQSNVKYPSEMGNLLGMMFWGLGFLIVLVFKFQVEKIYTWTIAIRTFFSLSSIVLYLIYRNPFFIALLVIILIGILITILGLFLDQRIKKISNEN